MHFPFPTGKRCRDFMPWDDLRKMQCRILDYQSGDRTIWDEHRAPVACRNAYRSTAPRATQTDIAFIALIYL
jgi:hypothetical protein